MRKPKFDQQVVDFLISLCNETNTPFSDKVKQLALDGKVLEIVSQRIHPCNYDNPASYYRDAVVCEFLRKFAGFDLGRDLKSEAIELFFENERLCGATNYWMKHLYHQQRELTLNDSRMIDFLQSVREKVSNLLGPIPWDLPGRFGKGSTFGDVGQFVTIPDKMSSRPTVTSLSRDLLPLWGSGGPSGSTAWFRALCQSSTHSDPLTVRGNRFTSVPKTATAERGICIEPSLNVYWQLAIGTHIKDVLKRKFGYDLYTAQTRHRLMAREASLTGRWATVDLKNASDLFSYWFVRMVLPDNWWDVVSTLRSPFTEINGKHVRLEKFSSMGNGFTFELMTVILTAVCLVLGQNKYALRGICDPLCHRKGDIGYGRDGDISVFGDDIICPPEVASLLLKCLPSLGLMVNEKKTFLSGDFRESCGGDFFRGVDVRAYNLQEEPNEPARLIVLANAIRRLGRQHRNGVDGFSDYRLSWFSVLDAIPSHIRRLRGPEQLGDVVIHDAEPFWSRPRTKQITYRRTPDGRSFVRGYVPVMRKLRLSIWDPATQLAAALYGVPSAGPTPRVGGKDQVVGYRKRWLAIGH